MRWTIATMGGLAIAAVLGLTAGCGTTRGSGDADVYRGASPVPFRGAAARITTVNDQYQFVVLDFSDRTMPSLGTELSVYRDGEQVGRVRVTEPTRARFATGDILEGTLQVGDEAR